MRAGSARIHIATARTDMIVRHPNAAAAQLGAAKIQARAAAPHVAADLARTAAHLGADEQTRSPLRLALAAPLRAAHTKDGKEWGPA